MRFLLAATCLTPVSVIFAIAPALAETVISTAITTPVLTGTANDDIRITSTGSVKPASGAAVTINSNDSVTNQGTIAISGANDSTGILANTNLAGTITNSGTITIDESFTPTDTDSDGDIDGPFAQGNNRFGIHVLPGGTFTGSVVNSGTITVEGNASAGIAIDSALAGSITNSGTITVTGNDSFGLRASSVSGNVTLSSGTISAKGANAVGVALDGNIGGALVIQNSVSSTGYRSTTAPADVSKLDADDLLQGGSAVRIAGNVAGGILFDARPKDNDTTDTDEDDDGVLDANESTAFITTFGSAPALQVGSATQDLTIGAVASSTAGHGLVIKGEIDGFGIYKGVSATAVSIGGTGHNVSLAGGMTVDGVVGARAVEANATAIRIGAGASVPEIAVTGTVIAQGAGTAATTAQAILIESGATVTTLRNSGTLNAAVIGTEGTAAAIVDKSGTLGLIENKGIISVTNAAALGDKAVAFDLSANGGGTIVRQLAAGTGQPAPSINGVMLFGAGSDLLDVADGSVTGAAKFGGGNNSLTLSGDSTMASAVSFGGGADTVQLAGSSILTGSLDFGGGGDILSLAGTSVYRGTLANSAGLAVTVGSGTTLDVTNTGPVNLSSLSTGSGSTIGVTLSNTIGAHTLYQVSGTANFGANSLVGVTLLNVGGVEGTYTIVDAGTLTGGGNLSATDMPFLFNGSLSSDQAAGTVSLTVTRKTAIELELNASEASAFDAILAAADSDSPIAGVFLDLEDSDTLRDTLQQMLPEHSGGAFEAVTKGSRLVGDLLADKGLPDDHRGIGFWIEQVAWGSSKSIGSTSSYDLGGWGAAAGAEARLGGAGNVGLSLAYLSGKDSNGSNSLRSNTYEVGAYWRGGIGPLRGFARATAGHVGFDGKRQFSGSVDGEEVTREAESDWNGRLFTASAGVSYEARMGRLSIRPAATIEHLKLTEKSYTETGGGTAFNLDVDKRTSDETAATATLALGYDLMNNKTTGTWFRVELEGGRRQLIGGSLGSTTARFEDGQPFTLTAEERTSGWLGGLRLAGGGSGMVLSGELSAEEQQGHASVGARVSLQFAL